MAGLTALQALDVSKNKLSGTLPLHWAYSGKLEFFAAEQNQLTGTIPIGELAPRYFGTVRACVQTDILLSLVSCQPDCICSWPVALSCSVSTASAQHMGQELVLAVHERACRCK